MTTGKVMEMQGSYEHLDKRSMPSTIVAEFLLEIVIPKRFAQFRKFIVEEKDGPMAVFIAKMRKWIMANESPQNRADIYKKLDSIPRELGGIGGRDPWGYHIVNTADTYVRERFYTRTAQDAMRIRDSNVARWEKFKVVFLDSDRGLPYQKPVESVSDVKTESDVKAGTGTIVPAFDGYCEASRIEESIKELMYRYPIDSNKKEWLKLSRTVETSMKIIQDSILLDVSTT